MHTITDGVEKRLRKGEQLDKVIEEAKLPKLGTFLLSHIHKKGISFDALAQLATVNRSTVYRICNNKMHPSPNILIRLSRVLEMNINDTQTLLKCGNLATLSGTRPRDIVIMDGIINNKGIEDINTELVARGYEDLYTNK